MGDEMYAEPAECRVAAAGGVAQHLLINAATTRLAVKVKCSDNTLIRVRPVFALVEPTQSINLEVTRLAGPAKEDRLLLEYVEVGADENDPRAPFKAATNLKHFRVPIIAQ